MDIDYLLALQAFRTSTHDVLTPFMEGISKAAISAIFLVPFIIYWIVDKKKGLYLIASLCLSTGINAVVKLTACVYRPWVRDPRVVPAGKSIESAGGYSLPSGHTSIAGAVYGGIALTDWKKKRLISVICLILLAVTCFSRNYLGVHTPQDVLAGLALAAFSLYAANRIFAWVELHPEKEELFLLITFILSCLMIAYITVKPYPMTYVDGKLVVDPYDMLTDGYMNISFLTAFPLGRYIEKRWIRFRPAGRDPVSLAICIAGIVPVWLIHKYLTGYLKMAVGDHLGSFSGNFIMVIYCLIAVPAMLKLVQKEKKA